MRKKLRIFDYGCYRSVSDNALLSGALSSDLLPPANSLRKIRAFLGVEVRKMAIIQSSDHHEKEGIFLMRQIIRNILTICLKSTISCGIEPVFRVRFTPITASVRKKLQAVAESVFVC